MDPSLLVASFFDFLEKHKVGLPVFIVNDKLHPSAVTVVNKVDEPVFVNVLKLPSDAIDVHVIDTDIHPIFTNTHVVGGLIDTVNSVVHVPMPGVVHAIVDGGTIDKVTAVLGPVSVSNIESIGTIGNVVNVQGGSIHVNNDFDHAIPVTMFPRHYASNDDDIYTEYSFIRGLQN